MKRFLVWIPVCCLIFVIGFLSGSFWSTKKFFSTFSGEGLHVGPVGKPPFQSSRTFQDDDFYENIIWGGEYKPMEKLEPLPKGDAKLAVKFKYDEKPAAGIGFTLAFNGKYRSDFIASNADGIAEISLPFGKWHLNRLECRKWPQQPTGDFILVSGDEEKLGTIPFNQMFMSWDQDGKTIALNKEKTH